MADLWCVTLVLYHGLFVVMISTQKFKGSSLLSCRIHVWPFSSSSWLIYGVTLVAEFRLRLPGVCVYSRSSAMYLSPMGQKKDVVCSSIGRE